MLAHLGDVGYNLPMKLSEQEKTQTWIIGVSGGSDSMALLHMCMNAHMHIVVAHMNYQKRESAHRDTQGVKDFCHKHHIPFELRYQKEPCHENFQAFARKQRYIFYRELIQAYDAAGVLIAHQLDDHLETYLIQKERNAIPDFYGLQDHITIFGCLVVRPLLAYTKAQLETYCHHHHVPYYLDESNLSDQYTRNRIRHTYIDAMGEADKKALCAEIDQENQRLQKLRQMAAAFLTEWTHECDSLFTQPMEVQHIILFEWIHCISGEAISYKEIQSLLAMIHQSGNHMRRCARAYELHKEYNMLSLIKHHSQSEGQTQGYSYTWDRILYQATPYFTLSDHGKTIEGVTVSEDDLPITIRSPQNGDFIQLRFGKKKLHRFFIDRKIPKEERKTWPVMVNRKGNIIFIAKIGCDISHFTNNPNVFVLK